MKGNNRNSECFKGTVGLVSTCNVRDIYTTSLMLFSSTHRANNVHGKAQPLKEALTWLGEDYHDEPRR